MAPAIRSIDDLSVFLSGLMAISCHSIFSSIAALNMEWSKSRLESTSYWPNPNLTNCRPRKPSDCLCLSHCPQAGETQCGHQAHSMLHKEDNQSSWYMCNRLSTDIHCLSDLGFQGQSVLAPQQVESNKDGIQSTLCPLKACVIISGVGKLCASAMSLPQGLVINNSQAQRTFLPFGPNSSKVYCQAFFQQQHWQHGCQELDFLCNFHWYSCDDLLDQEQKQKINCLC